MVLCWDSLVLPEEWSSLCPEADNSSWIRVQLYEIIFHFSSLSPRACSFL